MPSPLVSATLQAACLSALSATLAQLLTAYRTSVSYTLNPTPIVQFVLITLVSCPPNFVWQEFLEETFPGTIVSPTGERKLDVGNTFKKFAIDQTLGASVNTIIFIVGMGAMKGKGTATIWRDVQRVRTLLTTGLLGLKLTRVQDTFLLIKSGLKLWPLVSLFNFTVVPVHRRVIVGSVVGLFWGIYLNLFINQDTSAA